MSKKSLLSTKPVKADFSLLETFLSNDKKIYVFLVKNRQNVRSYIVFDLVSKSVVRYLVRDVSKASRRDFEKYFKILPFLEGARALSSLVKMIDSPTEPEA